MPDAIGLALAYLGKRERTEAEARARLRRADCAQDEIDDAIEELRVLGQLDDARFAGLFAQDRRELDGWGRERIARRLLELGVERELVDEALAGESAAELERAVELLERRFPPGAEPLDGVAGSGAADGDGHTGHVGRDADDRARAGRDADDRARERAFGILVRKGYESEVAADAVRRWDHERRARR